METWFSDALSDVPPCQDVAPDLETCSFALTGSPLRAEPPVCEITQELGSLKKRHPTSGKEGFPLKRVSWGGCQYCTEGESWGGQKRPLWRRDTAADVLGQPSSQSPNLGAPQGHAASPPGAPASRRVGPPSVGSRSAWRHKRRSRDRSVCATVSNDKQKAHDWTRARA